MDTVSATSHDGKESVYRQESVPSAHSRDIAAHMIGQLQAFARQHYDSGVNLAAKLEGERFCRAISEAQRILSLNHHIYENGGSRILRHIDTEEVEPCKVCRDAINSCPLCNNGG